MEFEILSILSEEREALEVPADFQAQLFAQVEGFIEAQQVDSLEHSAHKGLAASSFLCGREKRKLQLGNNYFLHIRNQGEPKVFKSSLKSIST